MKLELERYLFERLLTPEEFTPNKAPRVVIQEMVDQGMIQNHKQAWATLDKWARKDWYDYGTTLDLGWKTHNAPERI